jgi:anti-sigma factor RsiW
MTPEDGGDRGHLGDLVTGLVDGQLPQRERLAAERHLAVCPRCRAERDLDARMHSLVAGLPVLDPPAAIWAGMRDSQPRRTRWPLLVGAAAAVIGLSALSASPSDHRMTPQPVQVVAVTSVSFGAVSPFSPVVPTFTTSRTQGTVRSRPLSVIQQVRLTSHRLLVDLVGRS